MRIEFEKPSWSLSVSVSESGISFDGGRFSDLSVLPSPVFHMTLEDTSGNSFSVDSVSGWKTVRTVQSDAYLKFWLSDPGDQTDNTVIVTGRADNKGISW